MNKQNKKQREREKTKQNKTNKNRGEGVKSRFKLVSLFEIINILLIVV